MSRERLILIALLASIAINLVFVGGIGYRATSFREMGPRPFPPNVGWVVRDLSEERRAELEPLLQQSYQEILPMRREMFEAQRRVNELMASTDFDSTALEQAFTELRALNERYQTLSHQQTISLLAELTEAERQMAQEFVQRRGPRGRDGRPGFGGSGGRGGSPGSPGRPPYPPDSAEPIPPPPGDPDR